MNLNYFKLINLNLREYFLDILLLLVSGLLSNLVIFIFSSYRDTLLVLLSLPKDYDLFPLPLQVVQIALWMFLFLVLRTLPKIIETFLCSIFKNKYTFDAGLQDKVMSDLRFTKEWSLQGNVKPMNGGIFVSNSNSGCLIKKKWFLRSWKDFSANLDIAFPPQQDARLEKRIGIIFRAQNFEDYLMLEFYKDKNLLKFRPHVRLKGNWDAPLLDIDNNMINLTPDSFRLDIEVSENVVTVIVNNQKRKMFRWIIPTNIEVNLMQRLQDDKSLSKTSVPELYFRNKSGMFGFRCYGNQYVFVKSLSIS